MGSKNTQKGQVVLVVNWFDYNTATDSKVSWDWVEAATNTFYALGPHFVCAITG